MDNCTHTLIGVTLGNAVMSKTPQLSERDRLAVIWTAALASNFADFDFLMPFLIGEGKLGYLLHHRGHTHTFVLAPLMAALSMWAAVKITDARPQTRRHWLFLYGVAFLAAAFHIIADSWNDYGIHPFWPFSNQWFYGDSIFIIEPFFLLSMIPLAVLTTKTPWIRYFWGTLWVLLLSLIWLGPFARWDLAILLTAWAGVFFYAQWKKRTSALPAIVGVCLTLAMFFTGSQFTKANYREFAAFHLADETIHEVLTSPAPANPLCWRIMSVSTLGGDMIIRSGNTSLLPSRVSAHLCNYRVLQPGTAKLTPVNLPVEESISWIGEFRAPIEEFRRLYKENCEFAALAQFARFPYWQKNGEAFPAGDLRYDFDVALDFSEVDLATKDRCPRLIPPWVPPLSQLLEVVE